MQALDSRIASQQSQRDQTKSDFDRISELAKRAVSAQTQLDQARTNLDAAERNLTAMRGDRSVIAQQASEGAVLAPGSGRALSVPVSVGQVVLPGETIATLAEDEFILRLQLPERHAQFLRAGDTVLLGARGMQAERGEKMGTAKLTGVLRRLEQRWCRFEHPRDPRSMGLFRRLVSEALPKIAVENGGPNLKQKMGAPL